MGDTFAHFRLSNPPHPMWMSFETFHVNFSPRYASMYPPAQGFVLAIGEWLGNPWIGVLLSCAAMCAVIYWMLLAWLSPRWAMLGGVIAWLKFAVVSYWVNSYWGGAVAATGGALLLGALARLLRQPRSRDAFLFGLALAILANSRPYEGLIFSLPAFFVLVALAFSEVSWRNLFDRLAGESSRFRLQWCFYLQARLWVFTITASPATLCFFQTRLTCALITPRRCFYFKRPSRCFITTISSSRIFTMAGSARNTTIPGKASNAFPG